MKFSGLHRYPLISEDPVIRGKLFFYPGVLDERLTVCMATGRTKTLPVPTELIAGKQQVWAVYYEVLIGEKVQWANQKALKLVKKK